ncbi:MAG: diguanylate cyclase [Solirubrobacteraceae bacterium]|nr:diguanylate cyclase [Solirubrobacteraceae bacterium]
MRPSPATRPAIVPIRRLLDAPSPLPFTTWLERHQTASLALTLWTTVVVGWSAASGHSGVQLLSHVVPLLVAGFVTTRASLPLFVRELGMVLGLFTGAALVANLADGSVIAPVGYYLALALTALYERRRDLWAGLVVTAAHQAAAGTVIPDGARVAGLPDWAATVLFALSFLILASVLRLPWRANRYERAGRAAEAARLADHLAVSEIVVSLDTAGRVTHISDHGLGVLARSRAQVVGSDWVDLVVEPQQRPAARVALQRLTDPGAGPLAIAPTYFQFEHAILNGARERRIFRWRTTVSTKDGAVTGTVTAGVDITEVRQAERQLLRERRDLARLALLAKAVARESDARESVVHGVAELADATFAVLCELTPSGDDLVVTRSTRSGLVGTRIPLNAAPSGTGLAYATAEPVFVPDGDQSPLLNPRLRELADGRSFLFQPVLVDDQPAAVLAVAWADPIAELSTRQRNLVALAADEAAAALVRLRALRGWEEAALTDVLTGVPNRRAFERLFDEALETAQEHGRPLAVALMDLNGFKLLNDSEGHAAGDRVLKESASLWMEELRPTDTLARLGGDEFAVLLPTCGTADATAVADRLRSALRHEAGCGVGIAVWNREETAAELLHRADEALYADKSAGARRRLASQARLTAVESTGLLHAPHVAELDELTKLVTEFLAAPRSTITLVTQDRQVFASQHGALSGATPARSSGLDFSYCQHPATTGRELVVTDSREHALLRNNRATTELGVVSYAGIPLKARTGETVAVLCAIDDRPREWSPAELDKLRQLAHRAQGVIDGRAAAVVRRASRRG